MPTGPRILIDNACYHIMVRGNQKQKIFNEEKDFCEYLKRIKLCKRKYKFRLYGFCLMPNHVHMIGEVKQKDSLSKFMHSMNRSYTAYFNEKYRKVGHLWQGRFKSRVIVKDRYLIDCINYIEQNPVKDNFIQTPKEYRWSSYRERNLSVNDEEKILDILSL